PIASVEPHAPLGQRYSQMVGVAVGELAQHPHVRIGLRTVLLDLTRVLVAAIVAVEARAVVDIQALGLYARSVQKLHLLGLVVMNRGSQGQRVQMVIFESLLFHLGWPYP